MSFPFEFDVFVAEVGRGVEFLKVADARIVKHSHYVGVRVSSPMLNHCHQIQGRRSAHEDAFVFDQIVRHVQCFFVCNPVSIIDCSLVEVGCGSVQAHPLNYSIEGIFESESFLLLNGEQNIVLHFIEQPRSFGISQDDLDVLSLFLQVSGNACDCSSSAG